MATATTWVFWGTIICVVHFRVNGFDYINDVAGALMIAVGLNQIRRLGSTWLVAAWILAMLAVPLTLLTEAGAVVGLNWVRLAGVVALASGMCDFAHAEGDERLLRTWQVTRAFFAGLAALTAVAAVAGAAGADASFRTSSPAALPILLLAFVPLIQLLVALRRTRTAMNMSSPSWAGASSLSSPNATAGSAEST